MVRVPYMVHRALCGELSTTRTPHERCARVCLSSPARLVLMWKPPYAAMFRSRASQVLEHVHHCWRLAAYMAHSRTPFLGAREIVSTQVVSCALSQMEKTLLRAFARELSRKRR